MAFHLKTFDALVGKLFYKIVDQFAINWILGEEQRPLNIFFYFESLAVCNGDTKSSNFKMYRVNLSYGGKLDYWTSHILAKEPIRSGSPM